MMVMVVVPLLPCTTVNVFGAAVMVKSGITTLSAMVVVWTRVPDVPVMVTVVAPTAAASLTASVSVLFEVAEAGLKDAVTPAGTLLALKMTF